MTITDRPPTPSPVLPGASYGDGDPFPDIDAPLTEPVKRRRGHWPLFLALTIALIGTFVILWAIGVGDASAAGGCGGG